MSKAFQIACILGVILGQTSKTMAQTPIILNPPSSLTPTLIASTKTGGLRELQAHNCCRNYEKLLLCSQDASLDPLVPNTVQTSFYKPRGTSIATLTLPMNGVLQSYQTLLYFEENINDYEQVNNNVNVKGVALSFQKITPPASLPNNGLLSFCLEATIP